MECCPQSAALLGDGAVAGGGAAAAAVVVAIATAAAAVVMCQVSRKNVSDGLFLVIRMAILDDIAF